MKKLSRVLALSMALSLIFGMNAFASGSTSTSTTKTTAPAKEAAKEPATAYASGVTTSNKVIIDGEEVEVAVTVTTVTNAVVEAAQSKAKEIVGANATVLKAIEVSLPAGIDISKGVQITFNVPGVVAGQSIAVLHQKADGTWESVTVNSVGNGTVTATFTSLSPVAIVAHESSPKTGENIPYAAVMTVLCLAGIIFFAAKARQTNQ